MLALQFLIFEYWALYWVIIVHVNGTGLYIVIMGWFSQKITQIVYERWDKM